MNVIEIHLILNHIPILGVAFVCLQLTIAIICKNRFLQRVSLWFFLIFASIAVAVYLSGLGAEELVKTLPGTSKAYLQLHEKVARIASVTTWLMGAIALLGLVLLRNRELLFTYFVRAFLAMSILCTGLFVLTGYLGGQIRHAEIRSTLAEGLTTRPITIGVIAIMAAIIIATGIPLFLKRDKLLEKTQETMSVETVDKPGQQQSGSWSAWVQDPIASNSAYVIQPVRGVDANASPSLNTPSGTASLISRQLPAGTSTSFLDFASTDRSSRVQGPQEEPQHPFRFANTGDTSHPSSPLYPAPPGQPLFPPRSLPGKVRPGYQSSTSWGQEERFSIDEQPTLPHVASASTQTQSPGKPRKRISGKSRLFMILSIVLVCLILAGGGGIFFVQRLLKPPLPLQIIADIPLSGGATRFDYQSLDPHTGLLFIAHSGANMVTIFDTVSRRIVADAPGINGAHGVAVAPDLGRVYATATADNQVDVIDEHTHAIVGRIPVGGGPDGLIYDQTDHKIFVSDETGQDDAVIDARTGQRVAEIPLGGDAGDTEYDSVSHRIFVAVESLNQLVAIDPVTDRVIGRYPLPGCDNSLTLALDELQRLAFVACQNNSVLLMVDLHSMSVISTLSVGKSPDLMALDSGWHYLYVASESGVVSVFDEHGRTLRKLKEGYVAPGAHSIAVDQKTHYIYLPLQNVGGSAMLRIALFHQ